MTIRGIVWVGMIVLGAFTASAAKADDCAVTPDSAAVTLRWASRADSAAWTQHLLAELPRLGMDLLDARPSDMDAWCPNYSALDCRGRVQVWAYLMSAMSQFESGHRPEVTYTEAFPDASGNNVVSRGLWQISIESGRGYQCPLASANDLHDPLVNLSCGIRILSRWVPQDGLIQAQNSAGRWLGAARYWSIFRKAPRIASMQEWLGALPLCQTATE
jgi:hypothetical protein